MRPEFIGKKTCLCTRCGGPAVAFDSKLEARYFFEVLKPLQETGAISNLEFHPTLHVTRKVKVKADFSYFDEEKLKAKIIDVKAWNRPLTKQFKRNQALVKEILGLDIEVVRYR